jgi:hypothetical protein
VAENRGPALIDGIDAPCWRRAAAPMNESQWTGLRAGAGVVGSGRLLADPALPVPASLWRDLCVPTALAFVSYDRYRGRWLAVCPSPVGGTELPLPADAWGEVALAVPLVAALDPDAEALLICGGQQHIGGDRPADLEAFVAPLDICHRVVEGLRPLWRGFDGGDRAWLAIDAFVTQLRAKAAHLPTDTEGERAPIAAWWRGNA